jgi:hypothetical protein
VHRADVHSVPAGPLAVRWLGHELGEARAGALFTARVAFENAGTLAWHGGPPHTIAAGYHWLDRLGNPIVWDGFWRPVGRELAPGERAEVELEVRAPIPPGRYRLAFDLVSEGRWWFGEIGNTPLDVEVLVRPRDASTAVAHLPPGAEPSTDWQDRVRAAHEDGYAVVGSSVQPTGRFLERRRARRELAEWVPAGGRNPAFGGPLLFPSVLRGVDVELTTVAGLPAALRPRDEPWIHEGRAVVRIRAPLPAGRPRG